MPPPPPPPPPTHTHTIVQYNISAEDYFGNYRRSVGVMLEDNYRQLRGDVDKKMWLNAPTAVNAYYDPQFNGFGK